MTDFSDLKAQIADYANRQDWSDALVTGFVRQCEQKLNAELRIDRMIRTVQNNTTDGCAQLPDDWLEADFMLIANPATPSGWIPIRYKAREEFYRLPSTPYTSVGAASTMGYYTIEGRTLYFGGPIDPDNGTEFQMSYYAEVPVFSDQTTSWAYTKYPTIYLYGSLMHADLHAVGEEDKAGLMKQLTEDAINKLNGIHARARASGSRLARSRTRSFG